MGKSKMKIPRNIIALIYKSQYDLEIRDDDQLYTKEGEAVGRHKDSNISFDKMEGTFTIHFTPYKPLEYVEVNATIEVDPTPWCHVCGAMKASDCPCGPIAENE